MTASSALLVAALITLLGSAAIGVLGALVGVVRGAVLAPASGSVPAVTSRISAAATALAGVVLATILLLGALVTRAAATGHAPWSNLHEFSAAFAFGSLLVFLGLARSSPLRGLPP